MIVSDYARQIEELDQGSSSYRHEVERILRLWAADELSRVASLIDSDFLSYRIVSPSQAAQICRDEGAIHLKYT